MTSTTHQNHGTVTSYIIGFILAVILTVIPFYVVMNLETLQFARSTVYLVILIAAALQVAVQLVFFLHMDSYFAKSYSGLAFWFTIFTVVAYVVGTVWIFAEIHYNMMPY